MAMAAPAAAAGAGRARATAGAAKKTAAPKPAASRKTGAGSKGSGALGLPEAGDWGRRSQGRKSGSSAMFKGSQGRYRRMLIAEFIVCVMILGLSPLAKGSGEMGPVRFMKRGSATCALFIILGLLSSAGRGAARASAMFGALVTLVLLVDQREIFGKLATLLNAEDADDAETAGAGLGPDDSTDSDDGAGSVFV